jgi:hypothetical protein
MKQLDELLDELLPIVCSWAFFMIAGYYLYRLLGIF